MSEKMSARIYLTGDVHSADFPQWIARHAHKLGLDHVTTQRVPSGLEVTAQGAEEMLQALALGASLGPESVLVETMDITTAACS
ncbi:MULTISPECIES: acylphosphatase [Marivita]|uniref:Acylphosphatase n=2 Tax=Marivita cryptomonadis TaxID=505252 RepID=A0A9Q2P6S5_9RHOB|nr:MULTISPECIES: acylphosphatase [Marivita]MCR9167160.1 acylphosphatase [Paracoccaceae bacterium]MBM2320038.1 acylphosphatase [Marivita cryptomonadis]MBM2329617.1 acylphosphatase [Marivita cryptomonadis]MBM2339205.1 acylphosphatase [Marivita cryptomonadis]MBM2363057.1 acylphosphatase [Marivita cryptomonadis]